MSSSSTTLEIRALPEDGKLPVPPPASAAPWSSTNIIIAIASFFLAAAALGLGLGLGLGLKQASPPAASAASPSPSPQPVAPATAPMAYNFAGVSSLAMADPLSGRRRLGLGTSSDSSELLGLSSDGNVTNVTVLETPGGVIKDIFVSPAIANATILHYSSPLIIDTVPCALAYVGPDGAAICMHSLMDACGYLRDPNNFLPLVQFAPSGDAYFQCGDGAGAKIKVFSPATLTSTVMIPHPNATASISEYRLTTWAVVDDESGAVIAGLQNISSLQTSGFTALFETSGSWVSVYSEDTPRYMLQNPGALFISYMANGPTRGGLFKFDPENVTAFETAKPWLGFDVDDPEYAFQTVMPTAVNGGMDFYTWAVLESGHTIAGTLTSSSTGALTSGVTVDAYNLLNGPKCNLLVEYYPVPQTLSAPPFSAMIAIIPAEGATAAIAGLDASGECLVSLYNRTEDTYFPLLPPSTGICIQIITFSKAEGAIVYSGIYTDPDTGDESLAVGSVSIYDGVNEATDVEGYAGINTLTAIA